MSTKSNPIRAHRPAPRRTTGEMDDSYRFEEEDVNAKRGGGDGEDGDNKGDGGKTPKLSRKTSFGKKRGSSAGPSSAKKGGAKKTKK